MRSRSSGRGARRVWRFYRLFFRASRRASEVLQLADRRRGGGRAEGAPEARNCIFLEKNNSQRTRRPLVSLQRVARRCPSTSIIPQDPSSAAGTSWGSSRPPSCTMTTTWQDAPACQPTGRRSSSPLKLGEVQLSRATILKPPDSTNEAQSSRRSGATFSARKAVSGGARRHVDHRGRPRARRAPEGCQDRGSSSRSLKMRAAASSAAQRALRAISNLRSRRGAPPREPTAGRVARELTRAVLRLQSSTGCLDARFH